MKNILKLLFVSLIILPFSCHESENVIDFANEPINGAVVRGVEVYTTEGQSLINSSNDESAFVATIEEQDVEDGDLMAEIRMPIDSSSVSSSRTSLGTHFSTTTAREAPRLARVESPRACK